MRGSAHLLRLLRTSPTDPFSETSRVCGRFATEPVYYDPTDYFDVAQHEVDRQDELEYEVRPH